MREPSLATSRNQYSLPLHDSLTVSPGSRRWRPDRRDDLVFARHARAGTGRRGLLGYASGMVLAWKAGLASSLRISSVVLTRRSPRERSLTGLSICWRPAVCRGRG